VLEEERLNFEKSNLVCFVIDTFAQEEKPRS